MIWSISALAMSHGKTILLLDAVLGAVLVSRAVAGSAFGTLSGSDFKVVRNIFGCKDSRNTGQET